MDLRTSYMGMELKNPIVVSASPLSQDVDNIKRMEDAGASAIVMFSLFEEQLKHEAAAMDHLMSHGSESFPEALSYFPQIEDYEVGPERYLELIGRARSSVDIPIIGSLNGITNEGWVDYAREIEGAGAAAIELNVYYIPSDLDKSGRDVEQRYIDILKHVKSSVSIPVAIKFGTSFSSPGWMCRQFDEAGADALVMFNRFFQPDLDIDKLEVVPDLQLSDKTQIRIRLLWLAVLFGKVRASLAATTGVHTHEEVIKYIMAGADVVMTTSALLRNGIEYLSTLQNGLSDWMQQKGYESVAQMKGSMSQQNVADPEAFERANYIKMLERYKSPYAI